MVASIGFDSVLGFSSADCTSTVHGLQSIFQEQEMTETVHDTEGHGHLVTFIGKKGRSVEYLLSKPAVLSQGANVYSSKLQANHLNQ